MEPETLVRAAAEDVDDHAALERPAAMPVWHSMKIVRPPAVNVDFVAGRQPGQVAFDFRHALGFVRPVAFATAHLDAERQFVEPPQKSLVSQPPRAAFFRQPRAVSPAFRGRQLVRRQKRGDGVVE